MSGVRTCRQGLALTAAATAEGICAMYSLSHKCVLAVRLAAFLTFGFVRDATAQRAVPPKGQTVWNLKEAK